MSDMSGDTYRENLVPSEFDAPPSQPAFPGGFSAPDADLVTMGTALHYGADGSVSTRDKTCGVTMNGGEPAPAAE